jgi:hypothetical protein
LKIHWFFVFAHLDDFLHFGEFVHFFGDSVLFFEHLIGGLLAYFLRMLGVSSLDVFDHGEFVFEHSATGFDGTALLHGFSLDLNIE